MNTEEVGELVQRWNDLQAGAAADAELLRGDSQAASDKLSAAGEIETKLASAGLDIRKLVCP